MDNLLSNHRSYTLTFSLDWRLFLMRWYVLQHSFESSGTPFAAAAVDVVATSALALVDEPATPLPFPPSAEVDAGGLLIVVDAVENVDAPDDADVDA